MSAATSDEWDDPEASGPMPGTTLDCGCYIRRPRYDAILCAEHDAEVREPVK